MDRKIEIRKGGNLTVGKTCMVLFLRTPSFKERTIDSSEFSTAQFLRPQYPTAGLKEKLFQSMSNKCPFEQSRQMHSESHDQAILTEFKNRK